MQFIFPFVKSAHVTSFQEMHGDEHEMQSCLLAFQCSHHLVLNPHAQRGTGGTAVLISFSLVPQDAAMDIVNDVIVPGRIQRTVISRRDGTSTLVVFNIHNYGLSNREIERARDIINSDRAKSIRSPREFFVFVNGDFNFMAEGELPVNRAAETLAAVAGGQQRYSSLDPAPWNPVLSRLLELASDLPTHYCAATSRVSRIDRFFCASPSWLAVNMCFKIHTVLDPADAVFRGLSDHAPVVCSIGSKTLRSSANKPIPRHVFATPAFSKQHRALVSAADLPSLPADHRLELHAALLKEASSLAEEELLFTAGPSKSSRLSHLNHIARTVSQNNVTRASKLLTFSAEAGAHIEIVGDLVHFRDPEAFASLFDSVRLEQGAAEEAAHAKKSRQHAAIATARRSRMFSPFGRMVRLAGVIVEGAQRPAAESENYLGTYWARTFEQVHADFNEQGTLDFLNKHGARLDFLQVAPPDINAYRQYLARVPSSAPGPDGLPYAAWRYAGEEGCKTLHAAGSALASGYAPRESFNDSLTVFPP